MASLAVACAVALANIRLIRGDAMVVLTELIAPGTLDGVRVFFPDPWPKSRHHKRRFLQSGTIELIADRLRPGGILHIATDHADYAVWIAEILATQDRDRPHVIPLTTDSPLSLTRPTTKFEGRAEREGRRVNEFVYTEIDTPFYARVIAIEGKSATLQTLRDFGHHKNAVWGITARNREQNFALNLLMDPECDFITLTGTAGSGKTLMTLAAGLSQVLDERRYTEIIVTRVTVPVGEDIGFLPGDEQEKMGPWMGALDDNLEVLARTDTAAGEWGRAATNDLVRSKIKIKSLNFMRGRTFLNKFVIIDEAQNLTPKQMKTLITRAGPGTKIVCLGNLAQIDTPYLTEGSSGLTYAVDRFKGWPHGGHITLARGERSRLADFASDVL